MSLALVAKVKEQSERIAALEQRIQKLEDELAKRKGGRPKKNEDERIRT